MEALSDSFTVGCTASEKKYLPAETIAVSLIPESKTLYHHAGIYMKAHEGGARFAKPGK